MSNSVVADEMRVGSRPGVVRRGHEKLIPVTALNASEIGSDSPQTIRIELPTTDFWLPRTSYLQFKASVASTADADRRFRNGIWNLFSALRISVGGNTIEYIQNYNEIHSILYECSSEERLDAVGDKSAFWSEGVGGETERSAWSKSDRIYTLRLASGLLGLNKLIPLHLLGGKVSIELEMASARDSCVFATPADAQYTIKEVKFLMTIHSMPSDYTQGVLQHIQKQPIQFLMPTFSYHSIPVSSTRNELLVNAKHRSAKFLLMVHRTSANQSAASNMEFPKSDLSSVQIQMSDGTTYPSTALDFGAPSLEETRKCFGRLMGYHSGLDRISYSEYNDKKAIVGLDMECFLTQDHQSGIDLTTKDLVLINSHSVSPAAGTSAHVYVCYDQLLEIDKGFVVRLVK